MCRARLPLLQPGHRVGWGARVGPGRKLGENCVEACLCACRAFDSDSLRLNVSRASVEGPKGEQVRERTGVFIWESFCTEVLATARDIFKKAKAKPTSVPQHTAASRYASNHGGLRAETEHEKPSCSSGAQTAVGPNSSPSIQSRPCCADMA